jgi:NAD+ synthase (glutamine-hydrolysing)
MLFGIGHATFAVELGNDLWSPVPQSSFHVLQGAQIVANLSADREILMREQYRNDLLKGQSSKALCGYIYASAGFG